MSNRLKLIIADDEHFICDLLQELIDFQKLDLELVGIALDGEQLLEKMVQTQPDIVITDISMPKMDGLDVIRYAHEKGLKCRFIIISGYRQFDYAYNALKYDVEDYILKPIDQDELNTTLCKIIKEFRQEASEDHIRNYHSMQLHYLLKGIEHLEERPITIELLNRSYGTNFRPGCFKMLLAKMDYTIGSQPVSMDTSSMVKRMIEMMQLRFRGSCYTMSFEARKSGVCVLLNYAPERETGIEADIQELFTSAKNVTDRFNGLNLTFAVSTSSEDPDRLLDLQLECQVAQWSRMAAGINRIIKYESVAYQTKYLLQPRLDDLLGQCRRAFETVDIPLFQKSIEAFFALPTWMLSKKESMLFVRHVQDSFLELNEERISDFTDWDVWRSTIFDQLRQCYTFSGYKECLVKCFSDAMNQIAENISRQNTRPVKQALAYVEQNYGKQITLEDVANEINLSPVYFSSLFKRETGQNFTVYVTEYRMRVARDLLKNSDKNINEIADELGYTDARYFSKIFKKSVGVKPTEYRKIYG